MNRVIGQQNEPVYSAEYADLNGNGLEDALVLLSSGQWYGSGAALVAARS
ncbi:hypothetical protein [Thalassotalea sp. HSM 43]|nr:hypothetical protein [Thalassotalea sp. HSM 43]